MTDDELTAIEKRAAVLADFGPWESRSTYSYESGYSGMDDARIPHVVDDELTIATIPDMIPECRQGVADFIAHARDDIPALLAEVRRLRREIAGIPSRLEAAHALIVRLICQDFPQDGRIDSWVKWATQELPAVAPEEAVELHAAMGPTWLDAPKPNLTEQENQ